MSAPATLHDEAAAFMDVVDALARRTALSPLAAAMLSAAHFDIAVDSRAFARQFGIAHALVLRELNGLIEDALLHVTRRDQRTMRSFYAPTEKTDALFESVALAVAA